ncbi:MAG: nitrile hydratase subunit beta [Pseudomonadota bacterium]
MNGGADLGGMMGLGPVAPEIDEPLFHAEWEARVLGMVVALGAAGQWNIDESRSAREDRPPQEYLGMSYYEIWLAGVTRLLAERGLVTEDELSTGRAAAPSVALQRVLAPGDVRAALEAGAPVDRPAPRAPAFAVGERVITVNEHPEGHTRLPRYARGKAGRIERVHGCHVFPDSNASGGGEDPHWLYKVAFDAPTLWGSRAREGDVVTLDLWEPYLRGRS